MKNVKETTKKDLLAFVNFVKKLGYHIEKEDVKRIQEWQKM